MHNTCMCVMLIFILSSPPYFMHGVSLIMDGLYSFDIVVVRKMVRFTVSFEVSVTSIQIKFYIVGVQIDELEHHQES